MEKNQIRNFQEKIYNFYGNNKRIFPWRETKNSYYILVSEIMLQQTQTFRVLPKYISFLEKFPTIHDLAKSDLHSVLTLWQGLGYNRRAKYLLETAKMLIKEHAGIIPNDHEYLKALPGIGPYTAAAICTFTFNEPLLFLETNIRAVFLHEFFKHEEIKIKDTQILPYLEATLDTKNAKDWYYALMDYGAFLKSTEKNPTKKSTTYAKQSKFHGSKRKIRGIIIKLLIEKDSLTLENILKSIADSRTESVVSDLLREEFIEIKEGVVSIKIS